MTVVLAGATGTIGRATARALVNAGYRVVCPVREGSELNIAGATPIICDVGRPGALERALDGEPVTAALSCMASRHGAPADAWAVDHDAHVMFMNAVRDAGASKFVLLSAICVQKPRLAFQHAKLAFEEKLQKSGLIWSVVRPTAYFKSLSGQVARVQSGKPFLLFGDGCQTACKPISDRDLADYMVSCLTDPERQNRILPIGGPGDAITPRQQGERLFEMLGTAPRFKHVPFALMDVIAGALGVLGHVSPRMADKAELAKIGRYYARESMLVWDDVTQRYDAHATPSFGTETLWSHYDALLRGDVQADLGAHAVF